MPGRARIALSAVLVLAVLAGSVLATQRLFRPQVAYALVDETTLVVLRGRVEVQRPGESLTMVTDNVVLRVDDRVRTAADSYAAITYFDGSTTEIEPETEIIIRRLEKLPGGGQNISFHQEIGISWNRVEKLIGTDSRFETTTEAGVAFVRGTEYKVRVDTSRQMIVEALTGTVVVETVIDGVVIAVTVEPGFQTAVEPGQPPSQPVPVPPPSFAVRIDVEGPVSFFLTDERNRSVGLHPQANAYMTQIPGARFVLGNGQQSLLLSDPVESYEMVFKGQGEGGPYTVRITGLVDGREVATRAGGLGRALAAEVRAGMARPGAIDGMNMNVDTRNRTLRVGNLRQVSGPPARSRAAFIASQLNTAQGDLEQAEVLAAICHLTGNPQNPFQRMSVAAASLQSHLDHGDLAPQNGCPTGAAAANLVATSAPIATAAAAARQTAALATPTDTPVPGAATTTPTPVAPTPMPTGPAKPSPTERAAAPAAVTGRPTPLHLAVEAPATRTPIAAATETLPRAAAGTPIPQPTSTATGTPTATATGTSTTSRPTPTPTPTVIVSGVFLGFLEDRVGPGERPGADGSRDGSFALTVRRAGFQTISLVEIRAHVGIHVWDTVPGNGFWLLGISLDSSGASLLNAADGSISLPFDNSMRLRTFGADDGSLAAGGLFSITVWLDDGATAFTVVAVAPPPTVTAISTVTPTPTVTVTVTPTSTATATPTFTPAPPPNDDFANAQVLQIPGTVTGSNRGATIQAREPAAGCASTGASVWFRLTPTSAGRLRAATAGSNFDTVLSLYTGTPLATLTRPVCDDDGGEDPDSLLTAGVEAGITYHLRLAGYGSASPATGIYTLTLSLLPPLAHDNFANARVLETIPSTVTGTTVGTTTEPGEPEDCQARTGPSVWFRLTPTASGALVASTAGSSFDTVLALYTGASLGSLTQVTCDDDSGPGVTSLLTANVAAGTTYHLRLAGFDAKEIGSYTLTVTRPQLTTTSPMLERSSFPARSREATWVGR